MDETTYNIIKIVRDSVFLPLAVAVIGIAVIRMPIEYEHDVTKISKKLAFIALVIFSIGYYVAGMEYLKTTATNVAESASQNVMTEYTLAKNVVVAESSKNTPDEGSKWKVWERLSIWLQFEQWIKTKANQFLSWSLMFLICAGYIGRWFADMVLDILFVLCVMVSPLGLSLLTLKYTEGQGWRFLMSSIALGLAVIAFPVVDVIIYTSITKVLTISLAVLAPQLLGQAVGLTEVVVAILGGTASTGGTLLVFIIVLIFVIGLAAWFMSIALYFLAPFAFMRFLASGSVVEAAQGAFSGMTGHVARASGAIIEGGEAGARLTKGAQSRSVSGAVSNEMAHKLADDIHRSAGTSTPPVSVKQAESALRSFGGNYDAANASLKRSFLDKASKTPISVKK